MSIAPIVLLSQHPERFVSTSDRDYSFVLERAEETVAYVLVPQPSVTRLIILGALLIVLMNARPQGLLGTARVEVASPLGDELVREHALGGHVEVVRVADESVEGLGVVALQVRSLEMGTVVQFESSVRHAESRVGSLRYIRFADSDVCRIGLEWADGPGGLRITHPAPRPCAPRCHSAGLRFGLPVHASGRSRVSSLP